MKKLALIALFIGLGFAAAAQEFTVYGEGIMPTGRYGKSAIATDASGYRPISAITDTKNALGGASYGWGAGFQIAFPMSLSYCDLILDAGFRMNWVDEKIQTYFDDYARNNHTEGITSAPHYYNIPLMAGPRLNIEAVENLGLYAGLMAGLNIRTISDGVFSPDLFYDYSSAVTLALRASVGLLLFDQLRLEANWSWLGDNSVKAELYDGSAFHKRGVLGDLETMHFGIRLGWTFRAKQINK